jgi:hypothetical protein
MGYLLDIARKIQIPQRVDPLYYEKNELNELTSSSVIDKFPNTELRPPKPKANLSPVETVVPPSPKVTDPWSPEVQSLVDWFLTINPPPEPFYLENHLHVLDPAKFFDVLRHEIKSGPSGPRARMGTLQSDLRQLKEYFN